MNDKKIDPMAMATAMIARLSSLMPNNFLMTWEGSKIPRGASIDGIEIGWTQHGMITGKDGESLGYYNRLVEFGGTTGNTQVMLISTDGKTVVPPSGGNVEVISSPSRPEVTSPSRPEVKGSKENSTPQP